DADRRRKERRSRLAPRDPLPDHGLALPLEDGSAPGGNARGVRPGQPRRGRHQEAPTREVDCARKVDRAAVRAGSREGGLLSDPWNPEVYSRFASERSRPFFDLLELVTPIPGGSAGGLGRGAGDR